MFNQFKRIGIQNKDFKWWIRDLPDILTKEQLKERYASDNLNVVKDGKQISINQLVEICKENGKSVI